jgi:hypothetical protein
MVLDFEHRAKWLYAYIPLNNGTYRASLWLVQNSDTIIDELEREVQVINDNMLGIGAMAVKDLIFSRRIYIYHEMLLTDRDRTMIQSEALKSNFDVVFRGLRYIQDHKSVARSFPARLSELVLGLVHSCLSRPRRRSLRRVAAGRPHPTARRLCPTAGLPPRCAAPRVRGARSPHWSRSHQPAGE